MSFVRDVVQLTNKLCMSFFYNLKFLMNKNKTLVGHDEFGNMYYSANSNGIEKRWVIYKKIVDPTTVPPRWHIWLHYTDDNVPKTDNNKFVPNLTGTDYSYYPHRFLFNKEITTKKRNSYYESWPIKQ